MKSPTSLNKSIFAGISLLWLGLTALFYYNPSTHPWIPIALSRLVPDMIIITVFAGITFLAVKKFGRLHKGEVELRVKSWHIILLIWVGVMSGILVTSYLRHYLTLGQFGYGLINLLLKLALVNCWFFMLVCATYLSGRRILNLFKYQTESLLSETLLSMASGYMLYVFGLLGLSLVGLLQWYGVALLLVVLTASGFSFQHDFISLFTRSFQIKTPLKSAGLAATWLLAVFIVVNFSIAILPLPDGWDSLTYYFNIIRELAASGRYARGLPFYPMELVYSSVMVLTNSVRLTQYSDMMAIMTSALSGVFAIFSLIHLGRQIHSLKTGIITALLFTAMPLIGFFFTLEPKVEVLLVSYSALALSLFLSWRKDRKLNQLVLLAIVLAFSLLLKITALFLILGLGAALLYDFLSGGEYKKLGKLVPQLVLAGVVFMAVLLPWSAVHLWEHNWKLTRYEDLMEGYDAWITQRGTLLSRVQLESPSRVVSTGYQEDYGRFSGFKEGWWGLEGWLPTFIARIPMAKYVETPWTVTMLTYRKEVNAAISGLLLQILPIYLLSFLLFRKEEKGRENKDLTLLVVFSVTALLAWIWKGNGVAWYGISALIGLSLLTAYAIEKLDNWDLARKVVYGVFFVEIVFNLIIQLGRYGNSVYFPFAVGKMSSAEATDFLLPAHRNMAAIIKEDPEIQSHQRFVVRTGGFLPHFVNGDRKIFILDPFLDDFNAIYDASGGDKDKILSYFKQAKIKYLYVDAGLFYNDQTENKTLQEKVIRFMEFASEKLTLVEALEERGILFLEVK